MQYPREQWYVFCWSRNILFFTENEGSSACSLKSVTGSHREPFESSLHHVTLTEQLTLWPRRTKSTCSQLWIIKHHHRNWFIWDTNEEYLPTLIQFSQDVSKEVAEENIWTQEEVEEMWTTSIFISCTLQQILFGRQHQSEDLNRRVSLGEGSGQM
jgi:hypothetical protein